MFQALLSGVMIVIPCELGSLDQPAALLQAVNRFHVTIFTITPSLLRIALDFVQDCSKSRCLPNSLHLVSLECVKLTDISDTRVNFITSIMLDMCPCH